MKFIIAKTKTEFKFWDEFITKTPKGSHLLLSDWLNSYSSYGFKFEVCYYTVNDEIIGGFAAVMPKVSLFKFYVVPHGPIFIKSYENMLKNAIHDLKLRAKKHKCCYLQISLPISKDEKIKNHVYSNIKFNLEKEGLKKGKKFKYIYTSYGINWVDLSEFDSPDEYLKSLSSKVRRNVRMPFNKGAQSEVLSNKSLIKEAYEIIKKNAKDGSYSVRNFEDLEDTISSLINKKLAYFICVNHDNVSKASIFAIKAGGYLTNIFAGTLRTKPDIKLGYMTQWELIKKSFDIGTKGYNISMGGSPGVKDFKSKFNSNAILFDDPNYYMIVKSSTFKAFVLFEKNLKPHKQKIAKILSKFKK